jgi:predicted nucleotidyltransferase
VNEREHILESIRVVARQLGYLVDEVMFLGGAIVGLLLTDPAAPEVRATLDVDVVIKSSRSRYDELDEELRGLGFKHCLDEGAPTCRWVVGDYRVDIVRVGAGANSYQDRWTPAAIDRSKRIEIERGREIHVVTAPYFIAIKLEAFQDRGNGDYIGSKDIEDIVQVLDGRMELHEEIVKAEPELREFLATEFHRLLGEEAFVEAISAHLLPDAASQAREVIILEKIRRVAELQ